MNNIFSIDQMMVIAAEEQNKCVSYPKVGVVIAKDGAILSTGYRLEVPEQHAERVAIEKLDPIDLVGATIVTTLEPCIEMHNNQPEVSCADLITNHRVKEVVIGVLDPNGKIYCQGYDALLRANIKVSFFTPQLREQVEANTFKYGDCNKGYGPAGKRRVAVVGSGKRFTIQFSRKDRSSIEFRWDTLQYNHGIVDLIAENYSVRCAVGARSFSDISDPLIFRDPSHYARMKIGDLATIFPEKANFVVLIKLLEMTESDIFFQWQVRKT